MIWSKTYYYYHAVSESEELQTSLVFVDADNGDEESIEVVPCSHENNAEPAEAIVNIVNSAAADPQQNRHDREDIIQVSIYL